MSTTEITHVERLEPDSDDLLGFSLELPLSGTAKEDYCFEFGGWALARQSTAIQVELVANEGSVRRVPILFPRQDVARFYPETPASSKVGFWAPISVIGMTPDFELLVQVVLENMRRVPVGRICGRHRPLPSRFEPTIQPLVVTSLGRTGTTWMMRLLSEHPSIVTLRIYPYETRPAGYWLQLLGAMVEPANQAQSMSRLGNFDEEWWGQQDPFQRGLLFQNAPLQQWFRSRFVEQAALLCQRSVEECYREIATVQNQPNPVYFAEKHLPNEVPGMIWELYPNSREVFVVRDFRDMHCSIRAFNAKRGVLNFNRELATSEEQYISWLGIDAERLLSSWKTRRERACLVRYEDLILQPNETLQKVLSYLGLESGNALVADMLRKALVDTPELEAHRTAGSASASVGRWRDDLDPDSQLLCEQVFGDLLKEFGYSVGRELPTRMARQSE